MILHNLVTKPICGRHISVKMTTDQTTDHLIDSTPVYLASLISDTGGNAPVYSTVLCVSISLITNRGRDLPVNCLSLF